MVTIADLRKNSTKANLQKLIDKSKEDSGQGKSQEDNRFWKIERDKTGNAFAIIRFLPVGAKDHADERALPWVRVYSHSFKDETTGHWYIEDSLTTIGQKDPVAEANRKLWNSGQEDKARRQKRKKNYFSNIYVVKDPQHPENEGKVFLFRYGQKIYDKITQVMNPSEAFGDEPCDPFDLFSGKDFRLKVRTVEGYANYDLTDWAEPKQISDKNGTALSDEAVMEVFNAAHSLLGFLSPENFKTYQELEQRFKYVTGEIGEVDEGRKPSKAEVTETTVSKTAARKASPTPVEEEDEIEVPKASADDGDIDFDKLLNELK